MVAHFAACSTPSVLHTQRAPHPGDAFYPHNWNIMYAWNARTSTLFRDWLMLQLRRGITTDDQVSSNRK